jgi:hypothetical protein
MRILALIATVSFFSTSTLAASTIEYMDGYVLYSGRCTNRYVFSYFDGRRLQSPCIADSASVTLEDFLFTSRLTDCEPQVRVVSGTIRDGRLYADGIEEIWGCPEFDSGKMDDLKRQPHRDRTVVGDRAHPAPRPVA